DAECFPPILVSASRRGRRRRKASSPERRIKGRFSFHWASSPRQGEKMEAGRSAGASGEREISSWVAFAGILMIVLGCLDALWGVAAIANDEIVVVGGGHGVMILDITTWGWVQLILGALIGLTGLGLLLGNQVARVLALFLLGLNAVMQIVWFSAAPLWA